MYNNIVDESVRLGFLRTHEIITFCVVGNAIEILPGMLGQKLVQFCACAQNFLGVDINICGLTLESTQGLMNQNARVR